MRTGLASLLTAIALAILPAAAPAWASKPALTPIFDPDMACKLKENNGIILQWIDWDRRGIAWVDDKGDR